MLRQILGIGKSGNFLDHVANPDLAPFARINVLYGPNGSGKSSLSNAFLHAREGRGRQVGLQVRIEEDGRFRDVDGEDAFFDSVHVFNRTYVEENHQLDSDDPALPAVLTLGKRQIEDQRELAELKAQRSQTEMQFEQAKVDGSSAEAKRKSVLQLVSSETVGAVGGADDRFRTRHTYRADHVAAAYGRSDRPRVKLAMQQVQSTIASIAAPETAAVREPSAIPSVAAGFEVRLRQLLSSSPSTIVLNSLKEVPEASTWVAEGRDLHKHRGHCLFCGEAITDDRRRAIDRHFSRELERVTEELRICQVQLMELAYEIREFIDRLPGDTELFHDLADDYAVARAQLVRGLNRLMKRTVQVEKTILQKLENVLVPIELEGFAGVSEASWSRCFEILRAHNDRAGQHRELVRMLADTMQEHFLTEHESDFREAESLLMVAEAAIDRHTQSLAALRQRIQAVQNREGDPVPSAEKLTLELSRLLGRNELRFQAAGVEQFSVVRHGQPAVGMSEGERNAISLIHFIEQVLQSPAGRAGKAIVLIDDPVSSMDGNVFTGVSSYIWTAKMQTNAIAQLFLLTHNLELFRQWVVKTERLGRLARQFPHQWYQLVDRHRTTELGRIREPYMAVWPPPGLDAKKIRSNYVHSFIVLADKTRELRADADLAVHMDAQLMLPNLMRRFLEGFIASRRPDMIGDVGNALRDFVDTFSAQHPAADIQSLRGRLERYANVYSHNEEPDNSAHIDPSEILPALFALFEFVSLTDPGHFEGLCKVGNVLDPSELLLHNA